MELVEAAQKVEDYFAEHSMVKIAVCRLDRHERGWVAWYQGARYIQERSFGNLLVGNKPVLVRPDGQVEVMDAMDAAEVAAIAGPTYMF